MTFRRAKHADAVARLLYAMPRQHGWSWRWWVTLTYASQQTNPRLVEEHFRRWLNRIAESTGSHFYAPVGLELQARGALHLHTILGGWHDGDGDSEISARTIEGFWLHGSALAMPFERGGGAPSYLAKEGDWAILLGCPRRPRCKRRNGCRQKGEELPFPV